MLGMPEAPRHRDRLTGGASSPDEVDVLSPEHIGRFRGRVPPAELAFIQQQAGRRMARYGYALDRVELSGPERTRFWLVDWPNQMGRRLAWRGVEELQQRFPGRAGRKPGRRMIVEPG